jgi:hypothetical protein
VKTIRVVDFLGTPCLLVSEKGTAIAAELQGLLQLDRVVQVDFEGYEFLSSAFLNHAFGQTCIDMNLDLRTFHERVKVTNMQADDLEELELALDNAQKRRLVMSRGENPDQYYSSRLPA